MMRRKASLYIADRLVDLDDTSFILFNYMMEDLSNPTIVRNSFSQQITLKGTANNNRIFGDIFRLDRQTQYGDAYTGAFFDVTRKTPFAIYNEMGEIVESGYLKLDEVSRNDKMVEYKVTLFGGLGSFFYGLSYNEDGTPKTLADLRYRMQNGEFTRSAGHFGQVGGYVMLQDCWRYLENPEGYDIEANDCWWADIINFSPSYNGLPDKFSADKALVEEKSFNNMPVMSTKSGASSNLMVMGNKHSEWEMKDLRWYLQRPVFRVKALLDAVCDLENNGGYSVILDSAFFNEGNDLYWNGWITLPLIPAEDRQKADAIVRLLAASKSPAEYLISFAKVFGLVFLCDSAEKSITIMHRSQFYAEQEVIDITDKVDVRDIKISPVLAQSRYYQYGSGAIGEWAKAYKADYGRDYAVQRVNTGNEFNQETTIVTDGIVFKDAVEVQERNLLFVQSFDRNEVNGDGIDLFRLPLYESVKVQQWSVQDGEEMMEEQDITLPYEGFMFFDNPDYPLSDWLPKVQFHEGGKAVDGADVLMVFNGVKDAPVWESWARLHYRLTDDHPDMQTLNEGEPCWNFTETNSKVVTSLPEFRRCATYESDGESIIKASYEWGEPLARGVNGTFHEAEANTIYNRYWKAYQADRYDDDTYRMTCKVDLRGLRVGQELMRKFFYYDGAVFVLNAIRNHSLTTWDDTECEFIRVQDKTNYTK
jgi:hypothetical protein